MRPWATLSSPTRLAPSGRSCPGGRLRHQRAPESWAAVPSQPLPAPWVHAQGVCHLPSSPSRPRARETALGHSSGEGPGGEGPQEALEKNRVLRIPRKLARVCVGTEDAVTKATDADALAPNLQTRRTEGAGRGADGGRPPASRRTQASGELGPRGCLTPGRPGRCCRRQNTPESERELLRRVNGKLPL